MTSECEAHDDHVTGRGPRLLRSRLAMWLVFSVYLVVLLSVASASPVGGSLLVVLTAIALGSVLVGLRRRDLDSGEVRDRTRCERCGSILQGWAGLPRKTCAQCGHEQSRTR